MKKFALTLLVSISIISMAGAQARMKGLLPSDFYNSLPNTDRPSGVEGDVYSDKHWNVIAFNLYASEGTTDGYIGRYNIHANEFELRTQQGVRAMPGSHVKAYAMKDTLTGTLHSFVNAKDYKTEGTPLLGFFEVLAPGTSMLAKRSFLEITPPTHDLVTNAGSRDTKIEKRYQLYLLSGTEAYKIKNKKKLMAAFGDKSKQMEEYIKTKSLSMSEEDLRKIVGHYNELNQTK